MLKGASLEVWMDDALGLIIYSTVVLLLATVRMVRAAAHHQVNHQRRGVKYARQCAHTTPCSLLFVIGDKVPRS